MYNFTGTCIHGIHKLSYVFQCYMNSMIQCVSNTRPLLEYLCQHEWERETNPSSRMRGSLIKAFAKLVKSIWDSTSSTYISPTNFRPELNRFTRRFSGFG